MRLLLFCLRLRVWPRVCLRLRLRAWLFFWGCAVRFGHEALSLLPSKGKAREGAWSKAVNRSMNGWAHVRSS